MFILITGVLVGSFVEGHRRNRRSWQALVARMSPECRIQLNVDSSGRAGVIGAVWTKDARAAFRDSGVLMEMADYAERNAHTFDPSRMEAIRTAALELRTTSARRLIRQVLPLI